jgi:NADH-ubiquinone oxidoreductase chain 1
MTEHAAVIFVFFFLAEYASIVLICILTSILFLGGYLYDYAPNFSVLMEYINNDYYLDRAYNNSYYNFFSFGPVMEGLMYGLALGIKSCIMVFIFI